MIGYYFLDRSGKLFERILEYLRTGLEIVPSSPHHRDQLQEELNFYGVDLRLDSPVNSIPNRAFAEAVREIARATAPEHDPTGKWLAANWPRIREIIIEDASQGKLSTSIQLLFPYCDKPEQNGRRFLVDLYSKFEKAVSSGGARTFAVPLEVNANAIRHKLNEFFGLHSTVGNGVKADKTANSMYSHESHGLTISWQEQ